MNALLDRLASLVSAPVDQLIDALYVLRAPSSLVGIVPMARQFRDWRRDCVGLASCPELPDYTLRLALLDRVADLYVDDPDLMGLVIRRIKSKWKPLYPLTGDSVIGELLLIRGSRASNALALRQVSVWLLWVAQRFHIDQVTRDTYVQYLNSDSHRLVAKKGRRLYGAYLALHKLAAPTDDARRPLDALSELVGSPSLERCLELTLLARLARLRAHSPDRRALRRYAMARLGCSELELNVQIEHVHRVLPAEFALLLVTVWGGAIRASAGLGGRGRLHGVTVDRPSIRYGERLTEILARADEDDVHAGTVADFFSHDEQALAESERADSDDDDADDEDRQDPAFSLFLADASNPITAYYAAKSIQNAIEYQNAQLRWSNSTLAHAAVALVVQQVAAPGADVASCTPLGERARLAIGLSLMTGRALEEVARPCITAGKPPIGDKEPVGIRLDEHRLYIRAGRPELKHPAKIKPAFCNAVDTVLSIPLPEAWMPLVDAVGTRRPRSARPVIRDARRQLHNFERTFHITEKGIRYALIRALAERTAGDLGVQKVITDGVEADSRNVVHYASYRSSEVETWWREAAETLVGHLPDTPKRSAANYVGSQHAFDLDQLTAYFGEIKRRVAEAERNQDWPRLFNRMTLYLSYWLGLGLAHRKSLKPVPRILLEDQWVVVADKHRRGGSTDRLVPLTRALREQIDIYVSLASELSITIPALEPVIATEQGNEICLQYIRPTTQPRRKDVVPYQPKYQEQDEQLTSLPANWGRKVVRSASATLPGRYRDAELGHWVRGRHAWDTTSTFNAGDFHDRWLELQRTLEKRLGFEVLSVAGCKSGIRRAWQSRAIMRVRETAGGQLKTPAPSIKDAEVEALLRVAGERGFAELMTSNAVPSRSVALELALRAMRTQHAETIDRQREVAAAVCAWMREKWQVPIFAVKPRLLFANKVVLNAGALQTLGFLQRHVLAPFLEELACLPPAAINPEAGAVASGIPRGLNGRVGGTVHVVAGKSTRADRAQIELGRLVMIGIWRLGLASWGLVESWLRALHNGAVILAQGPNRYMVLQVRTSASRETMMRTVFLDDFSATYLAVERQEICHDLLPPLFLTTADKDGVQKDTPIASRRRRSKVEAALCA